MTGTSVVEVGSNRTGSRPGNGLDFPVAPAPPRPLGVRSRRGPRPPAGNPLALEYRSRPP